MVFSEPFFYRPDPWGTQTFWLWSWIYPRSPWDVSQLQKTASWQLFSMSIVQKPWYGHFHYFGAFWGPLAACFSILSSLRIWIFLQFLYPTNSKVSSTSVILQSLAKKNILGSNTVTQISSIYVKMAIIAFSGVNSSICYTPENSFFFAIFASNSLLSINYLKYLLIHAQKSPF